jgi:DNA-binding transcriptional ArsR family regulator
LGCNASVTPLETFKAEFFKALAHPLRIAILDELRGGETGVNELSARLGVEQSSVSQQLALLRSRNIVIGRKEGLNVYYSVRDATVFKLLEVAKQIFNNHLIDVKTMLAEMNVRPSARRR